MNTLVMLLIFNPSNMGQYPFPVGPMTLSQCEATIKHIESEVALESGWNKPTINAPYIMKCVEVPDGHS